MSKVRRFDPLAGKALLSQDTQNRFKTYQRTKYGATQKDFHLLPRGSIMDEERRPEMSVIIMLATGQRHLMVDGK